MSVIQYNFKQYLSVLRILHLALVAAVVVFGAVVYFVLLPLPDFQSEKNAGLFLCLSAGYNVFAAIIGQWLFSKQLNKVKSSMDLSDKLNIYRSASIIRWALLEGAILATLVFYLLSGNLVLLGIAGIIFWPLLFQYPNAMKVKTDLELSQTELALLEDPSKHVASSNLMKRF